MNLYKATAFIRIGPEDGSHFTRTTVVYASGRSIALGVLDAERAAVRYAKREYAFDLTMTQPAFVEIQAIELVQTDWQQ